MFWIGLIVGMFVLALISVGFITYCMRVVEFSWTDMKNLIEANEMAILNRDSRVEVYCELTNEKVFEAGFVYPWSDDELGD